MRILLAVGVVVAMACSKQSDAPTSERTPPAEAAKQKQPGLEYVGEPIKQDAAFPKHRWVKTEMFGTKKPYIGFTYVDKSKGNSIKGEEVTDLTPAQIKDKLHAKFPSSTLQPIPEGHPITPLTPDEIKLYDLPAEPEWVSFYK